MNKINDNIASYFDEDFIAIIYKDLKSHNDENVEEILKTKERVNCDNEIHIFELNDYKVGSVGKTSRELEKESVKFDEIKIITNDYNGPKPSYNVVCAKILFEKDTNKILGFQIANEKNIEQRLKVMKNSIDKNLTLNDITRLDVYEDGKGDMDVINLAAATAINGNAMGAVKEVLPKDVEDLVKNNDYLLDVREDYEYEAGHIKGAINIPLRSLIEKMNEIPKDKNIYVYCRSGHRSLDASAFLVNLGFKNVYNVRGGIIDISFNEYHKDKGDIKNSILTAYTFE